MTIAPVAPPAQTEPTVIVRLQIPQALYEQYEALVVADESDGPRLTVDEVITGALQHNLTTRGAAYAIDPASDREIRRMLGGRVNSPAALIDMIKRLVSVHVGGRRIELKPALQEQIYWACHSAGKSVEELAPALIEQAISEKFRA